MVHLHDVPGFLRRYFPSFIGAFFLVAFSCVITAILVIDQRFGSRSDQVKVAYFLMLVSSLVLCLGNFLVVRGRPWGGWVVVALLAFNLLALLFSYAPRSSNFGFLLATMSPLLAMLMFNSQRQREMRSRLVAIRKSRNKLFKAVRAAKVRARSRACR